MTVHGDAGTSRRGQVWCHSISHPRGLARSLVVKFWTFVSSFQAARGRWACAAYSRRGWRSSSAWPGVRVASRTCTGHPWSGRTASTNRACCWPGYLAEADFSATSSGGQKLTNLHEAVSFAAIIEACSLLRRSMTFSLDLRDGEPLRTQQGKD